MNRTDHAQLRECDLAATQRDCQWVHPRSCDFCAKSTQTLQMLHVGDGRHEIVAVCDGHEFQE